MGGNRREEVEGDDMKVVIKIKIDAEIVVDDGNNFDDIADKIRVDDGNNFDDIVDKIRVDTDDPATADVDDIVEYYRKRLPLIVKAMGL